MSYNERPLSVHSMHANNLSHHVCVCVCVCVHVQFVGGQWALEDPQFIPASFLSTTSLDCRLPAGSSQSPDSPDLDMVDDKPIARWQIRVSVNASYLVYFHRCVDQ